MVPMSFPAALCDPKGYLLFRTENDLKTCGAASLGVRLHIDGGISKLPGYKQMAS
jgi:hypothetical protein